MKSSRLHLLLAIWAACITGVLLVDTCSPTCDGMSAGDFVEDPMNCTQFYICLADGSPSDHAIPCDPGDEFDSTAGDCVLSSGPCKASCEPTTACHLTCNGTGDVISDALDCSTYYFCTPSGTSGAYSCPADKPHFDGTYCVNDETKCCTDLCTPYCQPDSIQIPDPTDCSMYYICLDEGLPDPSLHFPCDKGENFDIASGRCMAGAPCTTICPSTTAASGDGDSESSTGSSVSSSSSSLASGATAGPTGGSTVTPSSDCLSSLTCVEQGYVSMCASTCQSQHFACVSAGSQAVVEQCSGDLVFNPVPEYPFCVLPDNCPYTP